jgi:two-component system LytT family response regulator
VISTVIVDDMTLARERVRRYLAEQPGFVVVGEAASGAEALSAIARLTPRLVFLDVQLPDLDGVEVARRLDGPKPVIVFVTAYSEHAVAAFEVNALDYLVKPFDRARFAEALNRARRRLSHDDAGPPVRYLARLAARDRGTTELIPTLSIDYIDAAGHYLCIHVGTTVHLLRGTMSALEAQLDPAEFVRIHRSALVRLDRIKSLSAKRNGDSEVMLRDGTRLTLSRSYGAAVRTRLGLPEL